MMWKWKDAKRNCGGRHVGGSWILTSTCTDASCIRNKPKSQIHESREREILQWSIPLNFDMYCYIAIDNQNRVLVPILSFSNSVTKEILCLPLWDVDADPCQSTSCTCYGVQRIGKGIVEARYYYRSLKNVYVSITLISVCLSRYVFRNHDHSFQ